MMIVRKYQGYRQCGCLKMFCVCFSYICLFVLVFNVPVNNVSIQMDKFLSSSVEPILSSSFSVLLKDIT